VLDIKKLSVVKLKIVFKNVKNNNKIHRAIYIKTYMLKVSIIREVILELATRSNHCPCPEEDHR
jgi:hypothetical protein